MHGNYRVAVVLILVTVFSLGLTLQGFARSRAVVDSLVGTVEMKAKGSESWTPAVKNTVIKFGDTVRTGAESKAELLYDDGTIFRMASSTTVEMGVRSISMLQGNTWVKVVKRASKFEVITPTATAGVRGTVFDVEYASENQKTRVSVYSGKVLVSGAGKYRDRVVMLTQGSQTEVGAVPAKPRRFDYNQKAKEWAGQWTSSFRNQTGASEAASFFVQEGSVTATDAARTALQTRQTAASGSVSALQSQSTAIEEKIREKQRLDEEIIKRKNETLAAQTSILSMDPAERAKQLAVINKAVESSQKIVVDQAKLAASLSDVTAYEAELASLKSKVTASLDNSQMEVADRIFGQLQYDRLTTTDKQTLEQLLKQKQLTEAQKAEALKLMFDILNRKVDSVTSGNASLSDVLPASGSLDNSVDQAKNALLNTFKQQSK